MSATLMSHLGVNVSFLECFNCYITTVYCEQLYFFLSPPETSWSWKNKRRWNLQFAQFNFRVRPYFATEYTIDYISYTF